MGALTIVWIIAAGIFIYAVSKGFKEGYKKGSSKSFEDIKKKIKK